MAHRLKNGHARGRAAGTRRGSSYQHSYQSSQAGGQGTRTRGSARKFRQALELLNEAARERREDLYETLESQYTYLKDAMNDVAQNGKRAFEQIREQAGHALHTGQEKVRERVQAGQEKVREAASRVDQKVHQKPWAAMGALAIGSFILGNILGMRSGAAASSGGSRRRT